MYESSKNLSHFTKKKQDIHKENTNATLYMNNFITLSYKAHAFEHTTKTSPSPDFDTHAVILRPS